MGCCFGALLPPRLLAKLAHSFRARGAPQCKLPPSVHHFEHQVGGHRFTKPTGNLLVTEKAGLILKPMQSKQRGIREWQFMVRLWSDNNDCNSADLELIKYRPFIPRFYGLKILPIDSANNRIYLRMENLTERFHNPAILDVKISSQTWNPKASVLQQWLKQYLYPPMFQKLGFQIIGYKMREPSSETWEFQTNLKEMGNSEDCVIQSLSTYFQIRHRPGLAAHVLRQVIPLLNSIRSTMERYPRFHLYSSSVLIIYENIDIPPGNGLTQLNASDLQFQNPNVDVRMIDFAHAFWADKPDRKYLEGLANLELILQELLKSIQQCGKKCSWHAKKKKIETIV